MARLREDPRLSHEQPQDSELEHKNGRNANIEAAQEILIMALLTFFIEKQK